MADYAERTEQATPRRREKAREKGQQARSRDLSSTVAMGGVILVLAAGGGYFMNSLMRAMEAFLSLRYGTDPLSALRAASVEGMILMMPVFGAALLLSVMTNIAQGGIVMKPLEFRLEGLNPVKGIKRIFSIAGFVEFLKSTAKFSVVAFLFYKVVRSDLSVLPSLMTMDMRQL